MRSTLLNAVGSVDAVATFETVRRYWGGDTRPSDRAVATDGGTDPTVGEDGPSGDENADGSDTGDAPAEERVDMEELLLSENVVEEIPGENDLRLTEEFERVWYRRIEQMRGGDRAIRWLAATRDVDPDDLAVEDESEHFVITLEGSPVEEWPSEASFFAAIVAEPTLQEWISQPQWERLSDDERRELAARLLVFLERCPSCDGALAFDEETDADEESVRISLHCTACDATILSGAF